MPLSRSIFKLLIDTRFNFYHAYFENFAKSTISQLAHFDPVLQRIYILSDVLVLFGLALFFATKESL